MAEYVNQHGRKPGRGIRPWLLIPKILGVAMYFGGTVTALMIAVSGNATSDADARLLGTILSHIFLYVAVPGLLLAIVCGLLLLWHHGRVMLRMRWLRLKIIVLVIGIPLLHFHTSHVVGQLRTYDSGVSFIRFGPGWLVFDVQISLTAAILIAIAVIWLGRHKPRLGQKVATVAEQKRVEANA